MQMEVNRGLYMDEHSFKKNSGFSIACDDVSENIIEFANFLLDFKN